MKNIKIPAAFALCGFLLSFIAGLFSHSHFGHILLMALLFACVFAVLGFIIQYLSGNILSIEESASSEGASQSIEPSQTAKGTVVDIKVGDEDLPSEENSPQFFVGTNHQMLSKNDISASGKSEPQTSKESQTQTMDTKIQDIDTVPLPDGSPDTPEKERETDSDDGFVPLPLQETAGNLSGKEAGTQVKQEKKNDDISSDETAETDSDKDETLDDLPDLQEMKSDDEDEEGIVEDSDFSRKGETNKNSKAENDVKDAALMAKAISTVLAKDKQN